jgi:hypothetical protein
MFNRRPSATQESTRHTTIFIQVTTHLSTEQKQPNRSISLPFPHKKIPPKNHNNNMEVIDSKAIYNGKEKRKGGGGIGGGFRPSVGTGARPPSTGNVAPIIVGGAIGGSIGSNGSNPTSSSTTSSMDMGVVIGIIVGVVVGLLAIFLLIGWCVSRNKKRTQTSVETPLPPLGSESSSWNNASERDAYYAQQWLKKHTSLQLGMTWPTQAEIDEIRNLNTVDGNRMAWQFSPVEQGKLWKSAECTEIGTRLDAVNVIGNQIHFVGPSDKSTQTQLPFYLNETVNDANKIPNPPFYYYEVTVLSNAASSNVLALGVATSPYPPFRLPGWHQHSVAIHTDDGRIYIDDAHGGRPFLNPATLQGHQVVIGVGVDIVSGGIFFTRNGQLLTSQESVFGSSWGTMNDSIPSDIRAGLQSPIAMQRDGTAPPQQSIGTNEMKKWYPTIGACGDVVVQVNFSGPFVFLPANGSPPDYPYSPDYENAETKEMMQVVDEEETDVESSASRV